MKKIVIGVVLIGVLAVIGFVAGGFSGPSSDVNTDTEKLSLYTSLPWVEVTAEKVELVKGTERTLLRSGDELNPGDTVVTDENGLAVIHFPDGSSARVEKSSEVEIDSAEYDETDNSLTVRLILSAGKVWSRVVSLATAGSSWEVETSNAVVTVRGTAFGVQFDKLAKKSTVIGSENNVGVRRKIDNENSQKKLSKEALAKLEATVAPDTYTVISGVPAKMSASGAVAPEKLPILAVTQVIRAQDWVERNKDKDKEEIKAIEALKAKLQIQSAPGAITPELRKAIQKNIQEKFNTIRVERGDQVITPPVNTIRSDPKNPYIVPKSTSTNLLPAKPFVSATSTQIGKVVEFRVVPVTTERKLTEGQIAKFAAVIILADGTKNNVSAQSQWFTDGGIGKCVGGVFVARLAPEVAEMGASTGSAHAKWIHPVFGTVFEAKSEPLVVEAAPITEQIDERG